MPKGKNGVRSVMDLITKNYGEQAICRAILLSLAREIGQLPEVRRQCCAFNDMVRYPTRPMLTLFKSDKYSVYLLGWREGDWTDIHDHGPGREVGIYVVQGVVTEDLFAPVPMSMAGKRGAQSDRACIACWSRLMKQGDTMVCPENYIHRMGNIEPETAATLHVYGPTLSDMNLYKMEDGVLHWHEEVAPQH
jgi:predicted metal-dependent enzyme (double-stranded beta helix superfamily)